MPYDLYQSMPEGLGEAVDRLLFGLASARYAYGQRTHGMLRHVTRPAEAATLAHVAFQQFSRANAFYDLLGARGANNAIRDHVIAMAKEGHGKPAGCPPAFFTAAVWDAVFTGWEDATAAAFVLTEAFRERERGFEHSDYLPLAKVAHDNASRDEDEGNVAMWALQRILGLDASDSLDRLMAGMTKAADFAMQVLGERPAPPHEFVILEEHGIVREPPRTARERFRERLAFLLSELNLPMPALAAH